MFSSLACPSPSPCLQVLTFLHDHALPCAAADAAARAPQNSNLVLTAETRTRDAAEPSGEPDSLWGRMKGKMGDRVHHSQPEELVDRKAKAKKQCVSATVAAPRLVALQTRSLTSLARQRFLPHSLR